MTEERIKVIDDRVREGARIMGEIEKTKCAAMKVLIKWKELQKDLDNVKVPNKEFSEWEKIRGTDFAAEELAEIKA